MMMKELHMSCLKNDFEITKSMFFLQYLQ